MNECVCGWLTDWIVLLVHWPLLKFIGSELSQCYCERRHEMGRACTHASDTHSKSPKPARNENTRDFPPLFFSIVLSLLLFFRRRFCFLSTNESPSERNIIIRIIYICALDSFKNLLWFINCEIWREREQEKQSDTRTWSHILTSIFPAHLCESFFTFFGRHRGSLAVVCCYSSCKHSKGHVWKTMWKQ